MTSENNVPTGPANTLLDTSFDLSIEYQNDPEAVALRKYASQEHANVTALLDLISSLLSGKTAVTGDVLSDLSAKMVWLNQVAYVYRTIPSGATPGRERVITKMLEAVAKAQRDVKEINSWCRDSAAAILDEWNEERRLDKIMLELPLNLRNEESRNLHRRPQ